MTGGILPDPASHFGARVAQRLRDDVVIWMTTVGRDGTPQPNPVWFLWDGETILTYNRPEAGRVAHVAARPRVSLNFDGNGKGGDITVITGRAEIVEAVSPDHNPEYLAKYGGRIDQSFKSPENFASLYPTPIRIQPDRFRGF